MIQLGGAGSVPRADGLPLAYRVVGEGPLLVCLPGGPGRDAAYLEDLGGLHRTRQLLLVDQRGSGASPPPESPQGYTVDALVEDLEALRAGLGLDRMDLLGHSAGARVAREYSARYPGRVAALVLVTTVHEWRPEFDDERTRILARRAGEPWYPEASEAAEALPHARPAERGRLERQLRPAWYARWDEREQAHAAGADVQVNPRASVRLSADARERTPAELSGTTARTLVVAGDLDLLTPPACASRLADGMPDARLVVIDRCGHFPWVDAPEQFARLVEEFLAATG